MDVDVDVDGVMVVWWLEGLMRRRYFISALWKCCVGGWLGEGKRLGI